MTWDDMFELTKKLSRSDGGVQYRGFQFQFDGMMGTNQLGAPYFDPKTHEPKFLEDNFLRAFTNLARFYQIPGNDMLTGNIPNTFQRDKTVAMFIGTSGHVRPTAELVPNWDAAQLPSFPDRPGVGFQAAPEYFYITSRSQNRDAAFQVLAFIASDEYQEWMGRTLALLPVTKETDHIMKSFGADLPGFEGKNVKSLVPKAYAPLQMTPYLTIGNGEMVTAIRDYLGGKDVNTVLREAAERAKIKINTELGK
jgi:multiple sugar transport system substrate-binding protein